MNHPITLKTMYFVGISDDGKDINGIWECTPPYEIPENSVELSLDEYSFLSRNKFKTLAQLKASISQIEKKIKAHK